MKPPKNFSEFKLSDFTLMQNLTVQDAMARIDILGSGFCFVIDEAGKLLGVVTDGDIRRFILDDGSKNASILSCCSENFSFGNVEEAYEDIVCRLSEKIQFLPIIDEAGILVNFVTKSQTSFIPILEPKLGVEEFANVLDCLKSGWISSNGYYVTKFEEDFANYHDGRASIAVSNGTVALHLALVTLGVGPGDEVIVPSLTFAASAAAVLHAGATPVFCECDENLCIDPQEIDGLITNKTKAIIVVHLYGRVANMEDIQKKLIGKNLYLIEDAAEAIGSSFKGQAVGTFGDAATFSFFGNKTITTGEGGMVLFKDNKHADHARVLRDHGMSKTKRYWHEFVGYNYRMTSMQAAVGVAQLRKLSSIVEAKRNVLSKYIDYFRSQKHVGYFSSEKPGEINSNWLFSLVFECEVDIEALMLGLKNKQVDSRRIFYPLHLMPPYSHYNTSVSMARTIKASNYGLCLPSSATMTNEEVHRVIEVLDEELEKILAG